MSGAKYRDLSQLLAFIGAHSNGVTVKQVMHETERSRATVDRMIETLRSMQLVERAPPNGADHHRTVRWKACLKSNSRSDLPTDLSYSERSDLERLLPTLDDREGKSGLMKLLSREKPLNLSAIYDLSELVERDANVGRIGPQNIISKETREIVDEAIKGFQKISFVYRDELTARTVSPAGILFARFTYLVGFDRTEIPKTFLMDLISSPALLDEMVELPQDWDFKSWSKRSFGVFHGDVATPVSLLFDAEIASRVKKVKLHHSQQISDQKDGSVLVKLFCCGHSELLHELMHPDWAGRVRIIVPPELINKLEDYLRHIREKNRLPRD